MARLEVSEFWILKAFFTALMEGSFKKGSDFAAPVVDGIRIPVNKKQALKVIRDNASELLPNIDKKILENDNSLIEYLKIDSNRKNALGRLPDDQNSELTKVFEKQSIATSGEQVTTGQEAAGTMQGPAEASGSISAVPMGGFPAVPTFTSPAGRVVYQRPTQPPKPEIAIANKSGVVIEKPEPGAKLVNAQGQALSSTSKGGVIAEPLPAQSKLVNPQGQTISSASGGRVIREPIQSKLVNYKGQPLKYSSGFGSSIKSGFSSFSRSAKNFTGGVLKSGVGMLNTGNIPGRGAISGRIGGIRNAAGSAGSSLGKVGKGRWFLLLFFLIFSGALIAGLVPSSNQPVSTAPITGGTPNYGLDYTLPIKDPTVLPLDISDQVKAAFPGAKLEYWDDPIIKRSIAAGLNPALVLALWIEETGASQTTIKPNGGSEIPTSSGEVSLGHLGCAPWENQTINESLDCLFKFVAQNNFTNDQFPQFMAKYSGGPDSDPFSNNPNFTANIKTWYSKLIPSGVGAITPVIPTITGSGSFVYYCQGNTTWQTVCSLGNSGCGPTSLAMILSSFGASCNGKTCDPVEVDKIIRDSSWRSCGGATSTPSVLQSEWLKNLGFEVGDNILNGTTLDITQAKKYLDEGYLILGSSRNYPCANCRISGSLVDHIFVIDGVDVSLNSVDIRDANNCSYTDGNDENQSNRVKKVDAFTWLYAYPIRKVK